MIEAESIAARTEIKTIEAVNTHKNTGLVFPTMPPLTAFNQNLVQIQIINYINKILIHSLIIPKKFQHQKNPTFNTVQIPTDLSNTLQNQLHKNHFN